MGLSLRGGVGQSRFRRFVSRFDWGFFFVISLVVAIGLLNLYSAVHETAHSAKFEQQVLWVSLGLVCFFALTLLDYHTLHRLAWIGLGCVVVALVAVRIFSDPTKGAARWLELGPMRIQPSELTKIVLILALARILQDARATEAGLRQFVLPILALTIPVMLVASQPDLGTASLSVLVLLSMAILLVKNLWPVWALMLSGVAALPLLWGRMHAYQKSRVLAFLDPAADPTGAGWHAQQSIFAVGSGRVTGKGYLNATQNYFNFLPEHWTDFPFSVWAEEWGFLGAVFLLAVLSLAVLWCVHIALKARDRFGCAICVGVAAMIFWHMVVNTAMVLGVAPVVGVTLPLISYGGSSVLTFFVGLGLVSSVALRRHGY